MKKTLWILFFVGLVAGFYYLIYRPVGFQKTEKLITSIPRTSTFAEDFEKGDFFADLIKSDFSRWHELLLQNNTRSLRRPVHFCMIDKYNCIIDKSAGNYIRFSSEQIHKGRQSLEFHVEPFAKKWGGDSRIALRRHGFDFKKGDDLYFSGWFYLEPNQDLQGHHGLSFLAFRSWAKSLRYFGEPGRRFRLEGRNLILSDTDNWLPQPPIFSQDILEQVSMPEGEWVQIQIHMNLSDEKDGLLEVWQNGKKILKEKGQNLPQDSTVYSILEVGILNNSNESFAQTLYVDDIVLSKTPFETQN